MTTVRDALVSWTAILASLPRGTEIEVAEEGATPGAGAQMTVALVVRADGSAAALGLRAGLYDGKPRVFARAFDGAQTKVAAAVEEWKSEVDC